MTTTRIDPASLVGIPEIATQLGVAQATVHSWRKRSNGFPAPIATVATHVPVWTWPDVLAWAIETGRIATPGDGA